MITEGGMLRRMDGTSGLGNPRTLSRFGPSVPASAAGAVLLATVLATVPDAIAQSSGQGEPSGEQSAAESPSAPPKLTNLRYTKDYSYLRDPAKRIGAWWEPFKYIPLDASGTSYLTLGAELRFREEAYRNFNWGEVPVDNYQ
jgi:hypothetical protein